MAYNKSKPAMAVMIGAPGSPDKEPDHDEGEFHAPEGFDMEGKKPGEMIEAVVELEIKDNGMLCVRKLNGMDVEGYEDKETPKEEEPKPDAFTDNVMGGPAPEEE